MNEPTIEMIQCRGCGATIDLLSVFPGKLCLACHAKKFDADVKRNGGTLPRPDFTKAIRH